jgi:glycosyltransferase 2 family protein
VGGDAVKVYDLGRSQQRVVGVLCGTILDRIIGLCGLTLLALLAVPAAWLLDLQLPPLEPLLLAMLVWMIALMVLLSRRLTGLIKRTLLATPLRGLVERGAEYSAEFSTYRQHPGALLKVGLLAVLVQFLRVSTHMLIAAGLGIYPDGGRILQLFVLVPLLGILVALPISINGLGVREMAAASLFVAVGVVATEADAVAIEALAYGAMVLVSIIGGILFLTGSRRRKRNYSASGL